MSEQIPANSEQRTPHPQNSERQVRRSTFFAQKYRFAITSLLILIPCFWHRHIQAGDSGSHVYNAWLADLAAKNQAPGVYTVWRWDNILFDLLLSAFGKFLGWNLSEKLAISVCVLIFFWGVFALVTALSGKRPWTLLPGLAMLAYGYTFHVGFFNYYLSIGLSCIGLALLHRGGLQNLLLAAVLLPLSLLAHPIGFLWFLGTAAYLLLWRNLGKFKLSLPIFAILAAVVTHIAVYYLFLHGFWKDIGWSDHSFLVMNGTDQFSVFGPRYWFVSLFFLLWGEFFLLLNWGKTGWSLRWLNERRLLLELLLVTFCWTSLLPQDLLSTNGTGWIGLIISRLTLITAIFTFCLLATIQLRIRDTLPVAACAVIFFIMIFQDTAKLERLQANAEHLVAPLPFGSRVLRHVTLSEHEDWRAQFIYHTLDRACIEHCFAYSNYEAPTRQFRVRAQPGNPIVTADQDDGESMEAGEYEVQEEDLPMWELDQCDPHDWTILCLRELKAGDLNGAKKP